MGLEMKGSNDIFYFEIGMKGYKYIKWHEVWNDMVGVWNISNIDWEPYRFSILKYFYVLL